MLFILFIFLLIVWVLSYWSVINCLNTNQYIITKDRFDNFFIVKKDYLKKYFYNDIFVKYIEINFYSFTHLIMGWDNDLKIYFYKHCKES